LQFHIIIIIIIHRIPIEVVVPLHIHVRLLAATVP